MCIVCVFCVGIGRVVCFFCWLWGLYVCVCGFFVCVFVVFWVRVCSIVDV